jgi:pentatricopeptide repeat protein
VAAASGTADASAAANRSPGATLAVGADRLLLRPFDRRDVLRPIVMSYFVDRLASVSSGASPAVTEARQAARTANFPELAGRLAAVDAKTLDAAFLRGIERYASGELEAAAQEFNAAIDMNADFLPAIFYLGACYAAGGKDREAVGAWQAALISESDARIVYEVLVDALLRLNDVEKAKEILQEARERWQGDDVLVPRAAAVAAAGREPKAALDMLDSYLDAHPAETDALFLAMRLLYQASADGKPLVGRQEDAARMAKYAKQYDMANGSERAIVERWLTFVRSRQ